MASTNILPTRAAPKWLHGALTRIGYPLAGFVGAVLLWGALTTWPPSASFARLPGPLAVATEWVSFKPTYGISLFVSDYYLHIGYSLLRAWAAFALACLLGVPLGIMMGWHRATRDYASALVSLLRPIPPLAWVPLAILLLPGSESAVIFVTFLVAFFATVANTVLGVDSIDRSYFRAAACLGASRRAVLFDVILPGALPNIFTGLQIAMGAAWFSLAAGEMIAAQYGLGYLIWEAYNLIQYPTIVIGMGTLGLLGYLSSALIRRVGRALMTWRASTLGAAA